jgi:hypothetical protein
VAGNVVSNAVWARLKKGKLMGEQIAKYDQSTKTWIEDTSQPVGAKSIAVD